MLITYFIRNGLRGRGFLRPRVVVGIPSGATEVEKRAVIDATLQAGAREAYLIEQPMASAIGAGCQSPNQWEAWSWTSAAGQRKSPSSPSVGL